VRRIIFNHKHKKMKKVMVKALGAAVIFAVSFLGVSVSRQTIKVAGESSSVTLPSLAMQVKAYCNEATYFPETNDGRCTGKHNDPASRCDVDFSTNPKNCVRDH
jgi:hypothetical protein